MKLCNSLTPDRTLLPTTITTQGTPWLATKPYIEHGVGGRVSLPRHLLDSPRGKRETAVELTSRILEASTRIQSGCVATLLSIFPATRCTGMSRRLITWLPEAYELTFTARFSHSSADSAHISRGKSLMMTKQTYD